MPVIGFNQQSSGVPQLIGELKNGYVKAWGFFGFWLGKSQAGLQQSPNPSAFNLSVRDGIYVRNDPAISGRMDPIVLPWTGQVWVLNDGSQPGEQVNNVAFVDMEQVCG